MVLGGAWLGSFRGCGVGSSQDAFFEPEHVEVHKQAQFELCETQIGQKLRFMNGVQFVHGFEFEEKAAENHQIHAISAIELGAFVEQGEGHLALVLDAEGQKFQMQRPLIIRFIKAGAVFSMNGHGGTNHLSREFVAEVFVFDGFHGSWVAPQEIKKARED